MADININIKINRAELERTMKQIGEIGTKQLPFAERLATTALAQRAVTDLQAEMRQRFDRPTPFTLGAFYAKPATKSSPDALVLTREFARRGRPAWAYIQPEVLGGARNKKGFELKLSPISDALFVVPTEYTPLDQYGNISRGLMTQVLSRFNILAPGQNLSEKTVAKLRRAKRIVGGKQGRHEYFVGHKGGKKSGRTGIYKLFGPGEVHEILAFTSRIPSYKIILPVEEIVSRSVNGAWEAEFERALAYAISTAR